MTPYYVLLLLIVGLGLFSGVSKEAKEFSLLGIMVVLFFFMAFRARSVGADTNNYVWLFVSQGMSYSSLAEVWASKGDISALYDMYAWAVYQLCPYEQTILVCNSLIICVGVFLFIREFSETEIFSVLIYVLSFCYFFAFNGMRQSVAASIVLMALVCMNRKQYLPEILLLIVALGIHQSAFFMVPITISLHLLRNCKRYGATCIFVTCLAAALAVRVLYEPLFYVFSGMFEHYSMYSEGSSPYAASDLTQGRQAILYVVVGLFMFFATRIPGISRSICFDGGNRVIWLVGSLCVGMGIFCTGYELLARLIYYPLPALCCNLGLLSEKLDVGNKTVLIRMGLLVCYFVLCIYMLRSNYSIVVPYAFCWM
jgi:transmembrane protein EpsG